MGMPASSNGGGKVSTIGPTDICKVPSNPPAPFLNTSELTRAKGKTCSSKVLIINKKALHHRSEMRNSTGDKAGKDGGIKSGKTMGPCPCKDGAKRVRVGGKKLFHQNASSSHNGSNANTPVGKQTKPSQNKVFCMP